jgi:hypothetical protein
MKRILILVVALLLPFSLVTGQSSVQQRRNPGPVFQSLLMNVAEDGKETSDNFEIWEVGGHLGGPKSSCSIRVASFLLEHSTRVYLWNHEAERITEVRPGIFKVELNGRMSSFSGLEVIIEFNKDRSEIINLSGSMRSGTGGQSVRVFHVDRKTETRRLPPLRNPSWALKTE